jgi:acyl-CoA reductase-like NAD-dependent aldehyde dehydrogenase
MAIATKDYGLFIGGETVEADETRDLQEPATGVALGRAAMASPTDVDRPGPLSKARGRRRHRTSAPA